MRVGYLLKNDLKSISIVRSVNLTIDRDNLLILHLQANSENLSTISIKGNCDIPSKFKNETSTKTLYQELLELGYIDLSSFKIELTTWEENGEVEFLGDINLGD